MSEIKVNCVTSKKNTTKNQCGNIVNLEELGKLITSIVKNNTLVEYLNILNKRKMSNITEFNRDNEDEIVSADVFTYLNILGKDYIIKTHFATDGKVETDDFVMVDAVIYDDTTFSDVKKMLMYAVKNDYSISINMRLFGKEE